MDLCFLSYPHVSSPFLCTAVSPSVPLCQSLSVCDILYKQTKTLCPRQQSLIEVIRQRCEVCSAASEAYPYFLRPGTAMPSRSVCLHPPPADLPPPPTGCFLFLSSLFLWKNSLLSFRLVSILKCGTHKSVCTWKIFRNVWIQRLSEVLVPPFAGKKIKIVISDPYIWHKYLYIMFVFMRC